MVNKCCQRASNAAEELDWADGQETRKVQAQARSGGGADEPRGDGRSTDTATGKAIGKNPEEAVRQQYERILHDEYGYGYASMDTEVPIRRGSKRESPHDYADIVVYDSADNAKRDQFKHVLGIIETKRPRRKDGIRQLMSYMSATNCRWGAWTNGEDIAYLYKERSGEIKEDFIYQIPRNGEDISSIGKIRKDNLKPASNLKVVFSRMLNRLYANTNISRKEKLGNEMIRIIFCKIWDEKYYPNELPKFRVGAGESHDRVKARLDELFRSVKDELADDGVFDKNEQIQLEPRSVSYVMGELMYYSLLETDKDVVGEAFEVFAESKLVGEKGEFFTPREVVKTAIEIVDPKPGQTIFDPACGSGGFLIYALEHIWGIMDKDRKYRARDMPRLKKEIAERCFFGIDKEIDLVKIAKAYMAIVGDGRGKIAQQNSLHAPAEFKGQAGQVYVRNGKLKKFDIILTNPPFGTKIKVLKEDAGMFELGNKVERSKKTGQVKKTPKNTEPQELFIERCLQMLNDGGTLAIVLPETYFHAPTKRSVLEFLKKDNNIKAIIDLPHATFKPHNNAKTILVVLEKNKRQQGKIVMAVVEGIGHDDHGQTLYRYDPDINEISDEVWDDTVAVRREIRFPGNPKNRFVFTVDADSIRDGVYVPRYYWRSVEEAVKEGAAGMNCKLVTMSELVKKKILRAYNGHGSPKSEHKGMGDVPYIRVKYIVNWDVYEDYTAKIPETEYRRVKASGLDLRAGDVLFVRRGSFRIGTVALLGGDNLKMLLTREIKIFRISKADNEYGITAPYLVFLLSHRLVQDQLRSLIFLDTTLPNIGDRWRELRLPLFRDTGTRRDVIRRMGQIFEAKRGVLRSVSGISSMYGGLTT